MVTVVLGPVRSGKSARACALAAASGKPVIYAATSPRAPGDAEMRARIARHRRDRPASWRVVETAHERALPDVVRDAPHDACVVIDALGTWIASVMPQLRNDEASEDATRAAELLDAHGAELVAAIDAAKADVIAVAEETGWGIVPVSAAARMFRDALGRLTRTVAARAERVELVVAGYAVDVRSLGTPVDDADGD